MQFLL
jgi:SSS family solute:Na+ symporter